MITSRVSLVAGLVLFVIPASMHAQPSEDDSATIRRERTAQNAAIASADFDRIASFWVDDVMVTAGLGSLISGKDQYRAAFAADSALKYERLTTSVDLSDAWPLALERGTWRGWDDSGRSRINGQYAAQWVKLDGEWKIRSELFVALGCAGEACGWGVGVP